MPHTPKTVEEIAVLLLQSSEALSRGDFESAARLSHRVLALDPNNAASLANLGSCFVALNRISEATESYARAVSLASDVAQFHFDLGGCLFRSGNVPGAVNEMERAISLDPGFPDAYLSLSNIWSSIGDKCRALESLKRAQKHGIRGGEEWLRLGSAFTEIQAFSEALECFRRAIEKEPTLAKAHTLLGAYLLQEGRFQEAADRLKAAIDLDPLRSAPYQHYTRGKRITTEDLPLVEKMEAILGSPSVGPDDLERLHYALGKAYDDLGVYEKAVGHFDEANRLAAQTRRSTDRFSAQKYSRIVNRNILVFTPELFENIARLGSSSELPVFVVGMMRSGTTLVEQVLSSHPQVGSGGELNFWQSNYPTAGKLARSGDRRLLEVAAAYENLLERLAPGKKRVIDKMPQNFWCLGEIHAALPMARIIHCRRDPIDTCLSFYFTHMRESPDFAHIRKNIVFVYGKYLELMEHWRRVLPRNCFFELDYEKLVENQEQVTRQLIKFCGLGWDDRCLRPHENVRAVRTPSMWQVRQPVYRTSVGRRRQYDRWLGEFRALESKPEA